MRKNRLQQLSFCLTMLFASSTIAAPTPTSAGDYCSTPPAGSYCSQDGWKTIVFSPTQPAFLLKSKNCGLFSCEYYSDKAGWRSYGIYLLKSPGPPLEDSCWLKAAENLVGGDYTPPPQNTIEINYPREWEGNYTPC